MEDFKKSILVSLTESFRRSKKGKGEGKISRKTTIRPEAIYKNYRDNDADLDTVQDLNQAVYECAGMGFVRYVTVGFGDEIKSIALVDEKIEEIEKYLEENYGCVSNESRKKKLEKLIEKYRGGSAAASRECEWIEEKIRRNQLSIDPQFEEDLLRLVIFVENNNSDLYVREVSMQVFGNSKYIEEHDLFHAVCGILRKPYTQEEDETDRDVLRRFHVICEKERICAKGNFRMLLQGSLTDFSGFPNGVELFADDLEEVERININAKNFMTVENLTSWYRISLPDTVFFYLGGFMSTAQRRFLQKVYADNPDVNYYHFGDIDAGGLYILGHLSRGTGIPFAPYRMSVNELKNPAYQACLRPLTDSDRTRLASVKANLPAYADLAEYMLEHNVKLEQEIISLYGSI